MLPFLKLAEQNDADILIMNPNYNRDPKTNQIVPFCHSMEAHATFVWEHYVDPICRDDKELYVVAHSAGGACLASIQRKFGRPENKSNAFY